MLLRQPLPGWKYLNLEDQAVLEFATNGPVGFVRTYNDKVIIGEIQRAPQLLSQIQVEVGNSNRKHEFALSGSHNLLLLQSVSQSLAGRTSIHSLLPFDFRELQTNNTAETQAGNDLDSVLWRGSYPATFGFPTDVCKQWLDSYISTYVEKDVRMIRNVNDLGSFRRFLSLCAGRASQVLDLSGIGGDVGITHNTCKDWINILENWCVLEAIESKSGATPVAEKLKQA